MKPQMNLLYLNATGHVLSGFTRIAEPDDLEKTAEPFVGDGLLVNGLGSPGAILPSFVITLPEISLFRTDLDLNRMVQLRNLWLVNPDSSPKLQSLSAPRLVIVAPPSQPIKISLPPGEKATSDIAVLVLVQPNGQRLASPVTIRAKIQASNSEVSVNVPGLANGTYDAVIFVAGYPVDGTHFNVP
jgi:hypothetical protein